MRLCAKTARWACAASMVVLLAGCNGAGSGGPPDNGGNGGGGGSGGGSGGDGGSGGGGGAGGGSGGSTLSIVRTNQPVFEGGGLHASETGGIIAFDFVDADEDITVGYWDIDSDTAFLNVRVTGFDNTAGVADAMKPLREDFRCLGRKLLLTDQKTIGLFDADDGQGQALALPDGPGAYRYLPNTGLAGDGGRYGAAILENTGDVDFSKFDFHKLIAIDGDAESVIEFSHPSAESATSSFDFHHAAVAGSQVALLRDDLTDPFLGANTILVFDAAAPDTEPASHVMDFAVSESVLEFDGRFALMLNENEDRIVIFDTDQGTTQEVDPVFGGNIAQFGFDRMSKSINNGVIGYTTSEGDNFGFTIQAATGPATSATATRVGDDSATASSPPGYGNSVAVSASGRVFSAGERDISIQGGNLSEVTGGSASFITDGVGDAAADGFISASDIGAVGDLVFFKTGLDGNNNAANDTVLSYFMVP